MQKVSLDCALCAHAVHNSDKGGIFCHILDNMVSLAFCDRLSRAVVVPKPYQSVSDRIYICGIAPLHEKSISDYTKRKRMNDKVRDNQKI